MASTTPDSASTTSVTLDTTSTFSIENSSVPIITNSTSDNSNLLLETSQPLSKSLEQQNKQKSNNDKSLIQIKEQNDQKNQCKNDETKEPKQTIQLNEHNEQMEQKDSKQIKRTKQPKQPKQLKQPKQPKQPKQAKQPKQPKQSKQSKLIAQNTFPLSTSDNWSGSPPNESTLLIPSSKSIFITSHDTPNPQLDYNSSQEDNLKQQIDQNGSISDNGGNSQKDLQKSQQINHHIQNQKDIESKLKNVELNANDEKLDSTQSPDRLVKQESTQSKYISTKELPVYQSENFINLSNAIVDYDDEEFPEEEDDDDESEKYQNYSSTPSVFIPASPPASFSDELINTPQSIKDSLSFSSSFSANGYNNFSNSFTATENPFNNKDKNKPFERDLSSTSSFYRDNSEDPLSPLTTASSISSVDHSPSKASASEFSLCATSSLRSPSTTSLPSNSSQSQTSPSSSQSQTSSTDLSSDEVVLGTVDILKKTEAGGPLSVREITLKLRGSNCYTLTQSANPQALVASRLNHYVKVVPLGLLAKTLIVKHPKRTLFYLRNAPCTAQVAENERLQAKQIAERRLSCSNNGIEKEKKRKKKLVQQQSTQSQKLNASNLAPMTNSDNTPIKRTPAIKIQNKKNNSKNSNSLDNGMDISFYDSNDTLKSFSLNSKSYSELAVSSAPSSVSSANGSRLIDSPRFDPYSRPRTYSSSTSLNSTASLSPSTSILSSSSNSMTSCFPKTGSHANNAFNPYYTTALSPVTTSDTDLNSATKICSTMSSEWITGLDHHNIKAPESINIDELDDIMSCYC